VIHLVVLAAGRGRRLGALGDDTPKWLLDVAGATLADRQLAAVRRVREHSPALVRSVSVVVGHAAPAIASFASTQPDIDITLVDNPSYDEINNWYSLLLALRALDRAGQAERVVVFNADLLAHPDWFTRFLLDSAGGATESLIAVDTARPLTDESMKVSLDNGDRDLLARIGKVGVGDPVGEYVGMFMVRGAARDRLRTTLETYVGSDGAVDHWYEHAIGETAAEGVPWVVWSTPDSEWIEIDDESDYASALEMKDLR
jgi:choline kinase